MSASSKFLLLSCLLTISSCGLRSVKPEIAPLPPKVECGERKPTDPLPAVPDSTDWRLWAAALAQAFGIVEQSEGYRAETANCLDRHRKEGSIR